MIKKVGICFGIGIMLIFILPMLGFRLLASENGESLFSTLFFVIYPLYFACSSFVLGEYNKKIVFFPIIMCALVFLSIKLLYLINEGYMYSILYLIIGIIFLPIGKVYSKKKPKKKPTEIEDV